MNLRYTTIDKKSQNLYQLSIFNCTSEWFLQSMNQPSAYFSYSFSPRSSSARYSYRNCHTDKRLTRYAIVRKHIVRTEKGKCNEQFSHIIKFSVIIYYRIVKKNVWWVLFTGNTSQLQNHAWLQHNRTCVHHYRKYTLFSNTKKGNEWKNLPYHIYLQLWRKISCGMMTDNALKGFDSFTGIFKKWCLCLLYIYKDVVMWL